MLINEEEKGESWKEYIEELYSGQDHVLEKEQKIQKEYIGPPVMKEEFDWDLNELKPGKALGLDLIPSEILRALREKSKANLHRSVNEMYMTGGIQKILSR